MPTERDKYLKLVQSHPLRPLRGERDLDRAIRVIDSLLDRPRLSAGEQDYLNVLSDLVESYESEHEPESPIPDDRMLRHLIEANMITQAEVSRATGIATSTISAVLNGERRLTRAQIGTLASYFHVEPGVFSFQDARDAMTRSKSEATRVVV